MKRTQLAVILASTFALAAAPSFAADTGAADSSSSMTQKAMDLFKSQFSKADKDEDGTLNRQEAQALPHVAPNFDLIDTDKDGSVSREEVKDFAKFTKEDKDGDGTLDKNEAKWWYEVSQNFEAIDTDKDGTVSLAEINNYMEKKYSKSHSASTR